VRRGDWLAFESEHPSARINLSNSCFESDPAPIMESCGCFTCTHHSRAYLRYLLKSDSFDYFNLATIHNVHVMQTVCAAMRECMTQD
jgi:queuine tRNA-ribosyltransferase